MLNKDKWLDIKVAVITDLDVPSMEYWEENSIPKRCIIQEEDIVDLVDITDEVKWEELLNIRINSKADFKAKYICCKKEMTKKIKKEIHDQLKAHYPNLEKGINRRTN